MNIPSESNVASKLALLQQSFMQQLPDKISKIKHLWEMFGQNQAEANLAELHRMAHSLAGSGGTFGAVAVSTMARELEQMLKPLLDEPDRTLPISDDMQQQINEALRQLKQVAGSWAPSEIAYIHPGEIKEQREGNLIYLAEDDELLAEDIVVKLEQADYRVRHFVDLNDFEAAFEHEVPAVIVMDIVFKEGDVAGADVIARIKSKQETCPPVIFISVRDDVEVRLAAARAGATRYFCKPLDMNKLILTLDGLTARLTTKPYRVLFIDDDDILLEYYSTVLRDAGMDVETLSNPMEGLKALAEFKPDITVMDIYMPGCTGPELAQVIRQDDAWAMMPIMFLSTESNLNRQLAAMNLGGDDFLVKPVEAGHLVAAVLARAKRARWTSRLNKELQHALRESQYQIITMDQHDIVSTTDITGKIISVNDRFCMVSGYSREEMLGQNHRILKSGFHTQSFYDDLWQSISKGEIWRGTICNLKKNGNEYWVESTIVPFLDDKGKPYKYVSARTDITESRASRERLERGQLYAGIGTWDWDVRTNDVYWSDKVKQLYGYSSEVSPVTYEHFINIVHPEDKSAVENAINACLEKGIKYDIEHRVVWPDNSVHWMLERGDVLRNEDGEPLHFLGVVQDITQQKSAELGLIEARKDAEEANRAKSQFLSSMSHELRTPMNAILGFSQLLIMDTEQPLNESQKDSLVEVYKAGKHLLELINDVLDLARIEAGRIDLSIEVIVTAEVISEALQLITPLVQKRGIEISLVQDGAEIKIEQLLSMVNAVRADRVRLKQVLLNLLSNAVKYNRKNGKIIIACNLGDNNVTRISITDTGIGIDPKQQSRLFKAFERLGAEQTEIEGSGIGLMITKNIIELMGGTIGMSSQPDVGSTFWIELPTDTLHSAQRNVLDNKTMAQSENMANEKFEHAVLYIEDNPANLRLIAQVLGQKSNLRLWSAHEPQLGLELAAEHEFNLILLDINLPGMDGYEVLKHLRKQEATRHIPVIAISANAMPADIKKGLAAGFDDYITKPINITILLQVVEKILSTK
ncbi:MAG: response regulator [Gammaproteobacteria bacterium]|nr:response regulator [Gammaproteobacteria bacterium]